jgi:hypothetical protein
MFRIEQLEQRVTGGAAAAPADAPAPPAPEQRSAPAAAPAPQPPPRAAAPVAAPRASAPVQATATAAARQPEEQVQVQPAADVDIEKLNHLWPAALEVMAEDSLLNAALAETRPLSVSNGRLVIGFPPESDFIRKKAEGKRDVIQRAVHGLTGVNFVIAFETSEKAAAPEQKKITTDELIESVKRDFAATELDPSDRETTE